MTTMSSENVPRGVICAWPMRRWPGAAIFTTTATAGKWCAVPPTPMSAWCWTPSISSPARPSWAPLAAFRGIASFWCRPPMRRASPWITYRGAATTAVSLARASCRWIASWPCWKRPVTTARSPTRSLTMSSAWATATRRPGMGCAPTTCCAACRATVVFPRRSLSSRSPFWRSPLSLRI